jgi:hypothetical protein
MLFSLRVHNQSKSFSTEGADVEMSKLVSFQARREQQIVAISKWALLWKSIILSTIGKTAYPYAWYIRSLDLRNLTNLLDEPLFREHIMDNFFADDMAQFLRAQETPIKKRTRNGRVVGMRLDIPVVLELVSPSPYFSRLYGNLFEAARQSAYTNVTCPNRPNIFEWLKGGLPFGSLCSLLQICLKRAVLSHFAGGRIDNKLCHSSRDRKPRYCCFG